jgi:hypothetical protein
MADPNVITTYLKKYKMASKRHHPPAGRISIRWIPLRQNSQRVTGIEQPCDIMIGPFSTPASTAMKSRMIARSRRLRGE